MCDSELHGQQCASCGTGGRNLVVCIDGTSNQFGHRNTNVVELYSQLIKGERTQLTFYNSGIGTYAKPSWRSPRYWYQVLANKLDLAFALRFEKIILTAYGWLADNYQPGDKIYLFGFSRGAYQVRALSAMIDIVGLIHKGNSDQIPFAYKLYAASDGGRRDCTNLSPDLPQEAPQTGWFARLRSSCARLVRSDITADTPSDLPQRFKATFARDVRVQFVGAWYGEKIYLQVL